MNQLYMGFAEWDITPGRPMETIGFAPQMSEGIRAPLTAQVSVWSQNGMGCCLAAIDHIGFSRPHADELRQGIGRCLGFPRERVMLCFSHTHAAPNESAEPDYYQFVCRQVLEAAKQAWAERKPVKAVWGNGCCDVGVNRRYGCETMDRGGYEVYWSWLTYYIYHGRVYPFPREAAAELIRFAVQNKPTGGKTMFREMRRTLQVLPQEECEKLLQSGTAGVLALTGDDGYPYAVPISYAYAEGKLYFHCARTGHKIDAIRRSEKASFCVIGQDQIVPEELTTYYRSVIAFGRIRIVEEEKEKRRILGALADKYAPTLSEEKRQAGIEQDLAPVCILEMQVEHLSGKEGKKLAAERQRGRSQA